jgi:hypothetical protein
MADQLALFAILTSVAFAGFREKAGVQEHELTR